jgi:S1-C subfamily serine protease
LNVAAGEISATSGLRGDAKHLQISAPVQPGNSGGPLLDQSGNVIGIVVSKLNAMKLAEKIGDIPQNVNFAIKGAVAKYLLDINNVDYQTSSATGRIGTAEVAAQARKYTVVLECWK